MPFFIAFIRKGKNNISAKIHFLFAKGKAGTSLGIQF
jgi:hypothetical protein